MTASSNGGFIALMSAIIISVVLLVVVVSVSTGGFISRFNIVDSELKETSIGLAEACADIAILRLAADGSYDPGAGEVITVDDSDPMNIKKCEIKTVSPTWPKTVEIQAIYKNSYTNLEIILTNTTDPISVTSWKELP
jgi:hypothetical protein